MSDTEQRFGLTMGGVDRDEPGLIRERDGTVWLVNPDGTRTQLPGSNGGSQPLPLSTCYLENNTDTSSNAPVLWDTVYDARGNSILAIPAEMGLALTEADTSVEAQENGLWSVELMANPYADATAQLSLLMFIGGDYTGGPRTIPDLTHDEVSLLECCLHSDVDLVVGNNIHVIPQVVVDTPTAPGYKPLRYAVLKLIRLG